MYNYWARLSYLWHTCTEVSVKVVCCDHYIFGHCSVDLCEKKFKEHEYCNHSNVTKAGVIWVAFGTLSHAGIAWPLTAITTANLLLSYALSTDDSLKDVAKLTDVLLCSHIVSRPRVPPQSLEKTACESTVNTLTCRNQNFTKPVSLLKPLVSHIRRRLLCVWSFAETLLEAVWKAAATMNSPQFRVSGDYCWCAITDTINPSEFMSALLQ